MKSQIKRLKSGNLKSLFYISILATVAISCTSNNDLSDHIETPVKINFMDISAYNIALISEEMSKLKRQFPLVSFFVIQTDGDHYSKREILGDTTATQIETISREQLRLL